MARGRKAASDSMKQLLADAQRPDISNATAPRDVPGVDDLHEYGLGVYDALFRSRHDWSLADLMLIVHAAQCAQRIDELNKSILPGMMLIQTSSTVKLNPALNALNDQRRLFANLLRDAGLRQRDGASKGSFAPISETYRTMLSATTQVELDENGEPDWDSLLMH
jgi:hypothetical protein